LINKAMNHNILLSIAAGLLLIVCAAIGFRLYHDSSPARVNARVNIPASSKSRTVAAVCGRSILNSPYNYHGQAGSYSSGTAGLPTYGKPGSDFPNDTAGVVLPTGIHNYANYELRPRTVYYLLPGKHVGSLAADTGDSFVGGLSDGVPTILSGNYSGLYWAIDSNSTNGNQAGVTIEYLTIEKFQPAGNGGAVNQDSNTGWTIQHNTITLNAPGAGVILGAGNTLKGNCLTLNGQYGFQAENTDPWGADSLTGGPYNLTVKGNEISYNDTCDFEGLLDNPALGWSRYNPVPVRNRSHHCGAITPDGDQGGFKLWRTNGVTVEGNYIHNNWGPGGWADTGNANTTFTGNTITNNDAEAIIEETSYNFSITNNYLAGNGWISGLGNASFPTPAIYISESGSDRLFGGVSACPKALCPSQKSYPTQSIIRGNTLVKNSGSVFLWQNANRYCSDESDGICTLVNGPAGPFTIAGCKANLPSASINTKSYTGKATGAPAQNWWDGCLWKTENVTITRNIVDFNPASIPHCNHQEWPACGASGIMSNYGSPPNRTPGWVVPTQLTFFQGNSWLDNSYNGPSTFYAWNQGSSDNPVSWKSWTGRALNGDRCSSPSERSGGSCVGPFGQDTGSTYNSKPLVNSASTDIQQSQP
jgi:hypothetical protein